MSALTVAEFESWLRGYKRAWESRDPEAAAQLFTTDAQYFWTPFDAPQKGRAEIAAAWRGAVEHQQDVTFEYRIITTSDATGTAHWHTRLTSVPDGKPVELDGILSAEFRGSGQCRTFREWWHLRP